MGIFTAIPSIATTINSSLSCNTIICLCIIDYDCENQACIIEIRTHDVNDRENTLRVRHRITIAPGTAPDQLDKITTAAVEQVSRELRQEALVKIPQKGIVR